MPSSVDSSEGTLLKSNDEICNRSIENYEQLLSRNTTIDKNTIRKVPEYPVINLYAGDTPQIEEVKQAVKELKNNKAAGEDGIPVDLYKYGGISLNSLIHKLIQEILTSKRIRDDFERSIVLVFGF